MKFLIDTHTFLWFVSGSSQLSSPARSLIEEPGNQPYLSVASLWEMAIKASLGKLILGKPFGELIPQQLDASGVLLLNVTVAHIVEVARLPFVHRDPFDRLLVAQAMAEGIPLVSADEIFDSYSIVRMW